MLSQRHIRKFFEVEDKNYVTFVDESGEEDDVLDSTVYSLYKEGHVDDVVIHYNNVPIAGLIVYEDGRQQVKRKDWYDNNEIIDVTEDGKWDFYEYVLTKFDPFPFG